MNDSAHSTTTACLGGVNTIAIAASDIKHINLVNRSIFHQPNRSLSPSPSSSAVVVVMNVQQHHGSAAATQSAHSWPGATMSTMCSLDNRPIAATGAASVVVQSAACPEISRYGHSFPMCSVQFFCFRNAAYTNKHSA